MRPRALPIAVPPARHETVASYLARLAALHGLDGDELWKRVSVPTPSPARRTIDIHQLSALTGRPPGHLAGALPELRDPPPTWEAFRHIPQLGCRHCDARYPGGPVFRLFPHHRYVCTRHQYWIGPPDINHPGPHLEIFPDIVAAQRRHLRLVRRHGWASTYDAVLTAFMICAHLWEQDPDGNPGMALNQAVWNVRSFVFIPKNTEQETFSASRLFAAIYPEAISIAALLGSPTWRRLAAGDDEQLSRFTTEIGWRLGDPLYQPRGERDPIAHWIEQDCWRPPSPPPTTFAAAPGHRRPGHLDTTVTRANRERHDKAVLWFSRKRRPGQVILHHRTIHPVVIREWSTLMEQFAGAIWQSQRTTDRFKAVP
ncbi:hypothetical protein ACNF49_41090 [Actinomadura sp. ATCC 39365]